MQGQSRQTATPRGSNQAAEERAGTSSLAARGEDIRHTIDDLLDEIDGVLETNAEDFVKSYVQKGGQ